MIDLFLRLESMNNILRRPHWQVFLYMVFGNTFIPTSDLGMYIRVLYGLIFLIWVLKINEELYHRIQRQTELKLIIFQVNLVVIFCYLVVILFFTEGYEISSEKDNYAEYGWLVWIYVPFTFYIFAGYFYSLYFTSRIVNQLERELFGIEEDNSIQLFASLFFFPIGIWWIQPRINRILKSEMQTE